MKTFKPQYKIDLDKLMTDETPHPAGADGGHPIVARLKKLHQEGKHEIADKMFDRLYQRKSTHKGFEFLYKLKKKP